LAINEGETHSNPPVPESYVNTKPSVNVPVAFKWNSLIESGAKPMFNVPPKETGVEPVTTLSSTTVKLSVVKAEVGIPLKLASLTTISSLSMFTPAPCVIVIVLSADSIESVVRIGYVCVAPEPSGLSIPQ
jgi:hypothetical protein